MLITLATRQSDADASVNKKVADQMAPQLTLLVYLLSTTSNRFGFKHNYAFLFQLCFTDFNHDI